MEGTKIQQLNPANQGTWIFQHTLNTDVIPGAETPAENHMDVSNKFLNKDCIVHKFLYRSNLAGIEFPILEKTKYF